MNKITRMIGLGLASLTLATGVGVTTAGAAGAAPTVPGNFCGDKVNRLDIEGVRMRYPAQTRNLTDYQIIAGGHKAVYDRQKRVFWQVGVVRERLFDSIARDVSNAHYRGGAFNVARWQAVNWPKCHARIV